jgi:hypothetical protein
MSYNDDNVRPYKCTCFGVLISHLHSNARVDMEAMTAVTV